jgi:hypothetical protein
MDEKDRFMYPYNSYKGKNPKAVDIVFDANLQSFSQQVMYICALENGGKLPPHDAYKRIKTLWKQLKSSKKALLDNPDLNPPLPPEESAG